MMMSALEFEHPWRLLLLALALLPLIQRRRDALEFSCIEWLPGDPVGQWVQRIWQFLAIVSIALLVFGLAKPGQSETLIERIGRGAEIAILMDRSSSMDATIRRNAPEPGQPVLPSQSKNDAAREALGWLLEQRPLNRYALILFNTAAIRVSPFSDDLSIVQAGLDASDIGRGVNKTNMGLGLLAAIEAFEGRAYSGSRAILLVSDGGARLEEDVRLRIQQGLARNRIDLYFIYIQSSPNSPNLELVGTNTDSTLEEVALHVFFDSLDSDYRVFQAEDPASMNAAVKQIDELQNLPLIYHERKPRVDFSRAFFVAAFVTCLLLALLFATRLERLG